MYEHKIESKAVAGAGGGGLGALLSQLGLWGVGVLAFGGSSAAADVAETLALVPSPVANSLVFVLTAAGAFLGGYIAPHTDRLMLPEPADLISDSRD